MFTSSPYVYSFALLFISISLFLVFVPRFLPPKPIEISLADDLDDLALFRRAIATASPSTRKFAHFGNLNPDPKIAFLFLTNSDFNFAPLWEKFFLGHEKLFNVYVHADPNSEIGFPNGGSKFFQGRFIPAKRTQRASPTLISATRRLLANAIIDDRMNLYFAVLSQHCVPLHSFRFMYDSLFGNWVVKALNSQSRHRSYIEVRSKDKYLLERYHARGKDVMLPEVRFNQFRVGSQFFVLAKRHALVVLKDMKLWRKFKLPCFNLNSCYPEEHYFPTLLSMKDPGGVSGYTLTRVNWTGSVGGHPHTYHLPEVSADLVYKLRESNSSLDYFFARKFSPDCFDPLMAMADKVVFKD